MVDFNDADNLVYNTRDAKGNEIQKIVPIKQYPTVNQPFTCRICNREQEEGVEIKKIVSSNFTDWQYVGDHVCKPCSRYFSLYFYSYIISRGSIRLFNVREMAEEVKREQEPPFMAVITKSQKKHLFYKAVFNDSPDNFTVNLEEEQIAVNRKRLVDLFAFVEALLELGESKARLAAGEISPRTLTLIGPTAYRFLQGELKKRQIAIPLFLAQKQGIGEEASICNVGSILMS